MTRLDYEKQNRKEQPLAPVEPGHLQAITKHVKKRESAKRHRERTFIRGVEKGTSQERQRICDLLREFDKQNNQACVHAAQGVDECCGGCQSYIDPVEAIELILWGQK